MYFETHLLPLLELQGFVREIALDLRRSDGQATPVLFAASQQRDATGQLQSTTYTVLDARERRAFENELRAARTRAERAAKERGDFISVLSHEIRTPLQAMLGMTELLDDAAHAHERRHHLEVLRASSQRLLSLVNALLDFGKAEAGKLAVVAGPLDVRESVREVLELLQVTAAAKGLSLKAHVEPEVPPTVSGDGLKLQQILTNLIGNALKFTQRGGVTVRVARAAEASLHFAVEDTGIGIAPEHVPRLFEAFSQAGDDISRRFGGTGLGLAISKQLVELHGATLEVHSELGQGTRFSFALPYAALEPTPGPAPEAPVETPLGPGLVLVAEDNAVNALLIRRRLARFKVSHEVVHDGAAVVERVKAGGVSVVLMDLQMPLLDGVGALSAIRALEGPGARVPVVALSATIDADSHRELGPLGFAGCLTKPLRPAEMRQVLQSLLG